jgi:hypothetical protein
LLPDLVSILVAIFPELMQTPSDFVTQREIKEEGFIISGAMTSYPKTLLTLSIRAQQTARLLEDFGFYTYSSLFYLRQPRFEYWELAAYYELLAEVFYGILKMTAYPSSSVLVRRIGLPSSNPQNQGSSFEVF